MKDDLISRQAAIDVINKIFPVDPMRNDYTKGITCGAALATEYIKQLPPAEPKKGKWIFLKANEEQTDGYECSICKTTYHTRVPYFSEFKFCPNCGAEMEVTE